MNGINVKDFSNLKAFNNPPEGIGEVFYSVMYLLTKHYDAIDYNPKNNQPKTLSWPEAKKLMASPQKFFDCLLGF